MTSTLAPSDALVPKDGRLLDLGVGSGQALRRFLRARRDVTATGVDLAPNMLATARRLFEEEGIADRVNLVEADITVLPDDVRNRREPDLLRRSRLMFTVNILQFRGEKVAAEYIYIMDGFEAPEWRAQYRVDFDPTARLD